MRVLLLSVFVSTVSASCPNKCSGHGNCGANSKCTCFSNWQGNDCADRMCPYSTAWVDTAKASEDAHNYAECSNKGICDRKEGTCKCYPGYEGKACQRSECPNGCSGHGACKFIEDIATDTRAGGSASFAYVGEWDRSKTQGCVCDPYWTGTDCSSRMCPKGDDPLTTGQTDETQEIAIVTKLGSSTGDFVLKYTDNFGMEWTTRPIPYCAGLVCGSLAYPDATDTLITTATLVSDQLSSVDDFYNGMKIQFIGDACGTATLHPITDYVASTGVVTFTTDAAATDCGVGTTFRIVDQGTPAASDATSVTALGSGVADAYVGAALVMSTDTGCASFASVISTYTSSKVAGTADASSCNNDGTYSIVQAALPATIKKALLDLPNEVIRDVDVSLTGVSQAAGALTSTYTVTFKNPANNNGKKLVVDANGCKKAGCAPQFVGIMDYASLSSVSHVGSGVQTLTVGGTDNCGQLTRGSKVSQDDAARQIANYVITLADDSGVADTFTVQRNGGTVSSAVTMDTTAQTADTCGLTFTFNAATGGTAGDEWKVSVGAGTIAHTVTLNAGTKEAAECSNRGACDGETGECKCFAGHTDEDCSVQSSLA